LIAAPAKLLWCETA